MLEKNPSIITSLVTYGLLFQVQEAVLICALMREEGLKEKLRPKHWEWYDDPGCGNRLTPQNRLRLDPQLMPRGIEMKNPCKVFFTGRYLQEDVTKLKENVLYLSLGWQTVLGEFLSVSHMEKKIFVYQVSTKLPKEHAFKEDQLKKFRACLKLEENGYSVCVIYFRDSSIGLRWDQAPTGMAVAKTSKSVKSISKGAKEEGDSKGKHLEHVSLTDVGATGYYVRALLQPNKNHKMAPAPWNPRKRPSLKKEKPSGTDDG
mmetsp:Transcript_8069/g.15622  ORF Transcript_8069/g.15622 Transcript_8069/m.15622 type:complete len:260 (+) Transcript_8069:1360-2139(+)